MIAFEGIDGTGKSTQLRLLADALVRMGYRVIPTREPTDGPFGLRIRELYRNRAGVSKEEELELFMADRRQHVAEVIMPALQAGNIVLTDRYYLSTAAYQGASGLDPQVIIRQNELFAPRPDLALILTASPELGIRRIRTLRGESLNDFEQEAELRKVAAVFSGLHCDYIRKVDSTQPVEVVHRAIRAHVDLLLQAKIPVGFPEMQV